MPAIAAPIRPPKSAWDELEGRPLSQVIMFQRMAPIRPAKMMSGVIWTPPDPSLMMPPETVLATSVERNAPTRFSTAARATAVFGLMAPVAMGVAIAFAVSWNPLVKSKNSASAYDQRHHYGDFHLLPNLQSLRTAVPFPLPALHSIVHPDLKKTSVGGGSGAAARA